MSNRNQRPFLAALLLLGLLIGLNSCQRPEQSIGLGLQPAEDVLSVNQTDTTTLFVSTLRQDSLRSDKLSFNLLGNYIDPIIGYTMSSFYCQVRLTSNNVNFGDSATLVMDSLILALRHGSEAYGPLYPQEFEVYEINDEFVFDSLYYTNQHLETYPENLVLNQGLPIPISTSNDVVVGEDSLPPQIRIHLNTVLGTKLLAATGSEDLQDNTNFLEFFKGLYVKSNTLNGSVMHINVIDQNTIMTMYYHDDSDTSSYTFNLSDASARFNHIDHLYDFRAQELQFNDSLANQEEAFVQSGAGLKTKVDFPFLAEYATKNPGLVINKAELIIPIEEDLYGRYSNSAALYARTIDEEGLTEFISDNSTFNFEEGGTFLEDSREYRLLITRHIQDIIDGKRTNTGITIESNIIDLAIDGVRRTVIHGPSKSPDDPSQNMRLILTFSE